MIVEPFANDDTAANHNPIGRIFYSASATVCVPCSLAQEVGLGLGAQAGPARLEKVARGGGVYALPQGCGDAVQYGV